MHRHESSPTSPRVAWMRLSIFALGLLAIGCVTFRDFIFGEKVLLYKDIGSDSLNDYFPSFAHLSDYVRSTGLPSWSFFVGMGQNIFYLIGYLILDPVSWLPKAAIASALVFQHLGKILVAGLCFGRFLRLRDVDLRTSFLGATLFALSAYMNMGACWIVLADEAVCFALLLCAIEEAISAGRWFYLPFAIAVVSLVSVFHVYLCAVLLCIYVPARLIELNGWRPRPAIRFSLKLAAIAFLGVGISAATLLPSIYSVFHSARGSWVVEANWPKPVFFQTDSALYYFTALFRSLSNDVLGTGNDYHGWHNYLEAPSSYCGLLALLLLPQIFFQTTRRKRVVHSFLLALIIVPILLPWFRYLFWLFQGGYFRTFSLFSVFGILALSLSILSRYTRAWPLNLWALGVTFFTLIALLFWPVESVSTSIDPSVRSTIAIFLTIYVCLLSAGQLLHRQKLASIVIVFTALVEAALFTRRTVATHPTVTKIELHERSGYNDETVDALRDLKTNDRGFYRMTKTWASSPAQHNSLNDAMVFGYASTSSYSSFNSLNYINFLVATDAIAQDDISNAALWSDGLLGKPLLSTFACEKYVLNKPPVTLSAFSFYTPVARYGESELLRNDLFVPFGILVSNAISEAQLAELPSLWKVHALLRAAVLPQSEIDGAVELTQITTADLRQDIVTTSISDVIGERRLTSFAIRSFSQTRIEGTVKAEQRSILVFQMPFDRGWEVRLDGRPAAPRLVDCGLFGVVVDPGEHVVVLHFRPPWLVPGIIVTLLSAIIFGISVRRWPRLHLESTSA